MQPVGQVAFLLVWGLLMGTGAYLDGPELGRGIHTVCSAAAIAVTGLFTLVCGFAPRVVMLVGTAMTAFGVYSALKKPF